MQEKTNKQSNQIEVDSPASLDKEATAITVSVEQQKLEAENQNSTADITNSPPPLAHNLESAKYPELSIHLLDNCLVATLKPSDKLAYLSEEALNLLLEKANYTNLTFQKDAKKTLLENAKINQEFSIELAETTDVQIHIKVSGDKMRAIANFVPPSGGLALTKERLLKPIQELQIAWGRIDQDVMAEMLLATEKGSYQLALGLKPIAGKDAQFQPLFNIQKEHPPLIDEKDIANYFDTKEYVSVNEGQALMRRTPPTQGSDGADVHGKIIKPKKGKNLKFKKQKGSASSDDDENILVATRQGHPVLTNQGVKVDDTLTIANADLKSGNIDFEGSIMVAGNVMPQISIKVSGDIFIKGIVENATLTAGNNIVICGGVISESPPESDDAPRITSYLCAGADIHASFLNLTQAEAGNDISIQKYTIHCKLKAENNILVGEKGGKGVIIGGQTHCGKKLNVNIIGSKAYINSDISCGNQSELTINKKKIQNKIKQRNKELLQLVSILTKIQQDKKSNIVGKVVLNKSKKIQTAMAAIKSWLVGLNEELELIEGKITVSMGAHVQVNTRLFPNTHFTINNATHTQSNECKKCLVRNEQGKIKIES